MENFIFRKKRKMDEVKHREKVKELQDKYIPFLEHFIKKLKDANEERSREAQLKKIQSLYDLLKNRPKTLKCDVLEKTERVLMNLYEKFGRGYSHDHKGSESQARDEPDNSKAVALRPNLEVELRDKDPAHVDLGIVKQKLLQVKDVPQDRDVSGAGNTSAPSLSVLKQKASAIIGGDKVRPVDPRLERRAVTSEITLHVNRISTVISSRTDRNAFDPRRDAVAPEGFPIPLSNFQGGSSSVNLFCRRTQDKTFFQRRYPPQIEGPPHMPFNNAPPGGQFPICQGRPDGRIMQPDMNILNSPPLSNDDIQTLMGEPDRPPIPSSGNSATVSQSDTFRLALKYQPHPSRKPHEKSSSHLPIDPSGSITVSLDDPRLKKPIPPRSDPRRDPRSNRHDPPQTTTVSRYESRKVVDVRSSEYVCNNPPPPKKPFNPMERRSELDEDDYIETSEQYSAIKTTKNDLAERKKFNKSRAIESAPTEKKTSESAETGSKSQFDDMYRKNNFTKDYDKHVKNINMGIKDFKIPKKAPPKSDSESEDKSKSVEKSHEKKPLAKEKKQEKCEEKTVDKNSQECSEKKKKKKKKKQMEEDENPPEKQMAKASEASKKIAPESSAESEQLKRKSSRKRIKIIDTDSDSENSYLDSEDLMARKARLTQKTKADKTKKSTTVETSKSNEMSSRGVSEEKSEVDSSNCPQRSKTSTPEPVSSSSQVDPEVSGKCENTESSAHATNTEAEPTKDGVTKEWLESILSNLFNPNTLTKDKLLGIMKNVLDEKKFEQVKNIVESDDEDKVEHKEESRKEKEQKAESVPDKPEATIESPDPPPVETPAAKPAKKKPQKKNRELERLNEDIRTMFISEGVLTATGRRMCTELRKKSICYNESSPSTSPSRLTKVRTPEVSSPSKSLPAPAKAQAGPRKTRRKKQAAEETTEEFTDNKDNSPRKSGDSLDDDIAKRFFEEKQLDISRRLKVELQKLTESEIPKTSRGKKGKKKVPKRNDDETSSVNNVASPKKKKIRRNNIWFRGLKKKVKSSRVAAVIESEYPPAADFVDLPEPPIKKRPGPKSKTLPKSTSETSKEQEADTIATPMDIDCKVVKKEKIRELSNIKNNDVNINAVNHKNCNICGYSGKALVSHYVKVHSLNEVFCARLPKNISDFLKENKKGMLFAESYNMKLQYTGSKVFGHCIFCREEMYEPPNRWITHFTKHTGEYEYICSCGQKSWNLKVIRSHVKKCEERGSYVANEIMQDNGKCIEAYMCGGCNFIQLLEENTRNHIITEHTDVPEVHIVTLLNFSDMSVKDNHPIFLEMYKHNMAMMDENQDGVFKATDEKDNENSASKSILADISKTIPNEPGSGIANKLHERFGEKLVVKSEADNVIVKTEKPTTEEFPSPDTTGKSEDTTSMQLEDTQSTTMSQTSEVSDPNVENPIEPDDDEWEDIDSDSDESVMSQPGKSGPNKKLNRLVQKIGMKTSVKRKSDGMAEFSVSKKTKNDTQILNFNSNEQVTSTALTNPVVKPDVNRSGKIENLQYNIVDGQITYHCLLQKCLYIASSMDTFIDHLIRVHGDDKWSGHCNLCHDNKLLNPSSMILEFHHLVNDHIWKDDANKLPVSQGDIKEEVRPAIRLRRLSGDKLSAQMEQANSFKIPTTPTNIRSITIRRVSRSPDKPAVSSPGPSIMSVGTVVSSPGSLVITRAQTVDVSSSSSSGAVVSKTLTSPLRISTIDSLQTLKTLASPVSKSTGNTDDASRVINLHLGPQVIARRSTISGDLPKSLVENELKPWTKQPCSKPAHAVAKMLSKEVLCASFKCMGSECWYFTMSESDMVTHLKSHDKMIEDQLEQTSITDTCSWLECAYCDYMAGSTFELLNHQKKEHLHCEYLCPNCFYRACNANYVTRHLSIHHNSIAKVWQIKADYKCSPTENPVSCVKENVKLLMCKTCNLKFLNYNHFENHIKDHASQVFECVFCSAMIRIENMKKHMFCHSIGNYECIYCECATINKNNLAQHMCDRHQNKVLLYYNREEVQEHVAKFKLSPFDDFCTSRVITEFITKESVAKGIPKIPVGISVVRHASATSTVSPSKEKAPVVETSNQPSMPLIISNVVSLHAQPQSSGSSAVPLPSVSPAPQSSLVIKDVCTLSKEHSVTRPTTPVASGSRSLEPNSTGGPVKADVSSNSVVLEGVSVSKEAFEHQAFDFSTSLTQVIADWVLQSGVSQATLLKCAECDYQAKGRGDFMEHVDRSHTNTMLKCSQCVNVFWHSSKSLWNHLESHGYKRYFCFMCDYTGRSETEVADHCTKSVHKWLGYSLVLITPAIDSGIFLLCPKNTSFQKIESFKADFVRTIQKLSNEKVVAADGAVVNVREIPGRNSYGPDDIDKLPTKPVVAKNIFCKLCNYKTMIVKNLVRHFEAHRQAVYVPNLDPINPVPCLSEKNFDKMTNLACSSNMDSKGKAISEPLFIMQQRRFVCGVGDCSYITIDDVMLKYHLSTLHSNETSYICPHCKTELLKGTFSVENIVMHYRLHGPKLYMCDKCHYMSETTITVEKHIKTVHSGAGNIYALRDELKNETPVVAESATPQAQDEVLPKKWQCNECSETSYLKADMNNHVTIQHGAKYQYTCGYCSMGHHTRSYVEDHINMRHSGKIIIRETYSAIKGVFVPKKIKRVEKPEDSVNFWRRDENGAKSIRGIPCESSEIFPRATEEDEEEYSDEDINWEPETLPVKTPETEIVKRKSEENDLEREVKRSKIERIIQCTICGKTTKSALTMQVVHFPECHPGIPVSTRVITSICTEQEPIEEPNRKESVSLNGFYLKCYHCAVICRSVELFQKHYIENHTEEEAVENALCWYHVIKTMYCGLCQEVCDTYDEISKHIRDIHKTESVIAKSRKDGMGCGACNYVADDDQNLLRHAKLRHTRNTYKQIISQATLEQLLQIVVYPMKRCTACREIVIDIDGRQSEEHLRTKHSASVIATFVAIRNPIYICSFCHQTFDSETTFYTHTITHVESFKCSACKNFFFTYEKALEHTKETHTEDVPDVQFTWPTEKIIENHMVFPNGLVMTLEELQSTKFRFDQSKFKIVRNEVLRKLKITTSDLVI